jgi:hypothetical protein
MYHWDYDDTRFTNLKFEDIDSSFDATFTTIFESLDLPVETCLPIARRYDINRLPQDRIDSIPHVTNKSRSLDYTNVSDRVRDAFYSTFPADVIARVGYREHERSPPSR